MPSNSTKDRSIEPLLPSESTVGVVHSPGADSRLVGTLASTSFRFFVAHVGRELAEQLTAGRPDLVVVDHAEHQVDIVRLCRDIRRTVEAPIVVSTGRATYADETWIVDVLDAGAQVVTSSGSSSTLLLAQLTAMLRVAPRPPRRPARITVGDVVIDQDAHQLYIDAQPVGCPPILFSLLGVMASAPNQVTTRETLLEKVWGLEPGGVDTRRVNLAACLLRRVLGEGPSRPRIETVPRVGYRLAVD